MKSASELERELCEECPIYGQTGCDHCYEDALQYVISMLEQAQNTGHWIGEADEYYKAVNEYGGGVNEYTQYFVDDIACSVCLAMYSVIDNETERFDYCPNCGAKMIDPKESEV